MIKIEQERVVKRSRLAGQIGIVIILCTAGAFFVVLPRLVHTPDRGFSRAVHLTPQGIRDALSEIQDPELGINIVDLGLVREIAVKEKGRVVVTLIFTSPLCPLGELIVRDVEEVLSTIEGVQKADVKVDRSGMWNPEMMSEEGKKMLGALFK